MHLYTHHTFEKLFNFVMSGKQWWYCKLNQFFNLFMSKKIGGFCCFTWPAAWHAFIVSIRVKSKFKKKSFMLTNGRPGHDSQSKSLQWSVGCYSLQIDIRKITVNQSHICNSWYETVGWLSRIRELINFNKNKFK